MDIIQFLSELKEKKITLSTENGNIKLHGPKEAITDGIRQAIKENKKEICRFLEQIGTSEFEEIPAITENKDGLYPATAAQKRMYVLNQIQGPNITYNIPILYELTGSPDFDKIDDAFRSLAERHESLRTEFTVLDGEIYQRILSETSITVERISNPHGELDSEFIKFVKPFDLKKAPLIRIGLLQIRNKTFLALDLHHIITDGVSIDLMVKEFLRLYRCETLPSRRIDYKDFASWQNRLLKSDEMSKKENYWLGEFIGDLSVLNLPTDFPRPNVLSSKGDYVPFTIHSSLNDKLDELARKTGCTANIILMSALNLLLSRYSDQDDIVIGVPIAGRNHEELENISGMFVNTLAIRTRVLDEMTVQDFIKEMTTKMLKSYENQDYQFDMLVEKLNIAKDLSRNPLFDVMFSFQNEEKTELESAGMTLLPVPVSNKISKFDLLFSVSKKGDGYFGIIEYCADLFRKETIDKMSRHFLVILSKILSNPDQKLGSVDMLLDEERREILIDFNSTKTEYDRTNTITRQFEEIASKMPNRAIASYKGSELTYVELNKRANQLGQALRNEGAGPEKVIGIMTDRSLEMIIGIMAIIKAGGAYLPLDPENPQDRNRYLLEDSEAILLLTVRKYEGKTGEGIKELYIDDEKNYRGDGQNLQCLNQPSDAAYIIYTSGSTGKPKGVVIEHHCIINLLEFFKNWFKVGEKDNAVQFAPYTFDASAGEIFMSLLGGSKLHIAAKEIINDVRQFEDFLNDCRISFIALPPNYLGLIDPSRVHTVNKIMSAGSAPSLELYTKWREKVEFINGYGPTETTIISTAWREEGGKFEGATLPIGKPAVNTRIYILNHNDQPQPVGVPGEICISGDSLARGYIHNPELTSEKFASNPFEKETKMYRTGDIGKWLPDGNIEFVGRSDFQVKIRGYRIELGEIESQLLGIAGITEVVVTANQDKNGGKYLAAYYCGEASPDEFEIREILKSSLPEYMVPSCFMRLPKMPVNDRGKIDRKMLPAIDPSILRAEQYIAPRNEIENLLADIWKDVLGVERVGIDDNFFELGGHSLKAIQLSSKILKEFSKDISLKDLFIKPTVRELGELVSLKDASLYEGIEPAEAMETYALSSAQKRLFILDKIEKSGNAYNMPAFFTVTGEMDHNKLRDVFQLLLERHESLRTGFELKNGQPVQIIWRNLDAPLEIYHEPRKDAIERIIQDFVRPFDLKRPPLFRAGLIETGNNSSILMFDMHHIISDGVSMGILVREFSELYAGKKLGGMRIQYKDYSEWQTRLHESPKMKDEEKFWLNEFAGEIPILNLTYDFTRPTFQSFEGDHIRFLIEKPRLEQLKKLAISSGSTLYMALLALVNVLMAKYSGQEDIVIGTPVAGRPHEDLKGIIGIFINMLAMRNLPAGDKTFLEFLQEVKEKSLSAFDNQDFPFEELVEKIALKKDVSRNPLFDVIFALQNMEIDDLHIPGLLFQPIPAERKISKFDLMFYADEKASEIEMTLEYCAKLFKKDTIERMSGHFLRILEAVLTNPEIKIKDIPLITEEEKSIILGDFNSTIAEYPKESTIMDLFERQALKTPENTALIFGDSKMTYQEFNHRANWIGGILRKKGVKPDRIVGIIAERSMEMMIGIYGILKAGCAYLPIDTEYPEDRIGFMLEDSNAAVVLIQEKFRNKVTVNTEILSLDSKELSGSTEKNPEKVNSPHDLAYIIYTSGSTGKPKGVMIENYSVINRLHWMQNKYPIHTGDVILQKTPYSFDVSVWELFWWAFEGATLSILVPTGEKDPGKILNAIEKDGVTTMHFVPSMLGVFLEQMALSPQPGKVKSVKRVFASGEALTPNLVNQFNALMRRHSAATLHNLYGPTEATVDVSYFDCPVDAKVDRVPIGKPIDNIQLYVFGPGNQLMPIGVPGELCIAGDGVGRGYLNRPELTAEKFAINPIDPQAKMYRTGDLVRWLPDGNIEFLGRMDFQVKIRGLRIELGEIENKLMGMDGIKEAIVIAKSDRDGGKYLAAYYTTSREISDQELREYLKKSVPEYMVPQILIYLDKMPLNPNGKIDRKALPEPEIGSSVREYVAPRTQTEHQLAKIWESLLGVAQVGLKDNFFEMGGHSLKAIQLASLISRDMNREMPLNEVFSRQTLEEMANYLNNASVGSFEIAVAPEKDYYEASSAQKRIYSVCRIFENDTTYNMPVIYLLKGRLDKAKIQSSFDKLMKRQESLRTSFRMHEEQIVQKIAPDCTAEVAFRSRMDGSVEDLFKGFVRPFKLDQAPLVRIEIVDLGEDEYVLMFDMHHIISDGVSTGILIREFADIYRGMEPKPLTVQYKDFSEWQNSLIQNEGMKKQGEFWSKEFANGIPVLNIPTDYSRPKVQNLEGESVEFFIDAELGVRLKKMALGLGMTPYMLFMGAFFLLLWKYSGQEDIVVGTTVAGRRHASLEGIIGMFVNTLAVRNEIRPDIRIHEFLMSLKEKLTNCYENQDYPFEMLVDYLDIRKDIGRNPLFDVMFNYLNAGMTSPMDVEGLKVSPYPAGNSMSKFDLTLSIQESGNGFAGVLEYCISLFKRETIERMANHLQQILFDISEHIDMKLQDVNIMSEGEKNIVLKMSNGPSAKYPENKTITDLFEEQALKTPDATALVMGDLSMTYRELNEKSNRLGRTIRNMGIRRDSIVGIMAEKTPDMIVGILAILKAGGAYLPIDPDYPGDRVRFMVEDSEMKVLLTQSAHQETVIPGCTVLNLDDAKNYDQNGSRLDSLNQPTDLAYVIYTSGTTGRPKGVMIEHRNVVRLLFNDRFQFSFSEKDVWTMFHAFNFDFSVWEMYGSLLYGGKLIIIPKMTARDQDQFLDTLRKEEVTILNQTPQAFYNLISTELKRPAHPLRIRYVIFGGEALQPSKLQEWQLLYPQTKLINMYGITETTVHVTFKEITSLEIESNISNIGKPIPTLTTYVLDAARKLLPVGIPGELCVGGAGVGRGYLKRPELTVERFIPNPYNPGDRLYCSGDLVKLLENGEMEYLGRIDHQVKVRGYRIELGEIENMLQNHPDIREAFVLAKDDSDGYKFLCAYFLAKRDISVKELREYLLTELPDYMVPAYFIQMEKIPLTPNGKIDRKALPEPETSLQGRAEYNAPATPLEERLAEVWQEVLKIEKIGTTDNFFELGGDSIKAILVASKLQKYGLKMEIKDLFQNPEIANLSNHISQIESIQAEQGLIEGAVELTPIQKWFFAKDLTHPNQFNQSVLLHLGQGIDDSKFKLAMEKVYEHHDALRMVFHRKDGKIVQHNRGADAAKSFGYQSIDIRAEKEIRGAIQSIAEREQSALDIQKGELTRLTVFKTSEGDYLLIVIHHLVIDGVSWRILQEDIWTAYRSLLKGEAVQFQSKTHAYKDWASALIKYAGSKELQKELPYWSSLTKEKIDRLPADHKTDRNLHQDATSVEVRISKDDTEKLLKGVNQAYNTEINDILLSALTLAVFRWTGLGKFAVHLEGHGRENIDHEIDISRTVGWFTSIYPVILSAQKPADVGYTIKHIKEELRKIPHKGIGYGILKYLGNHSLPSPSGWDIQPDIMFNYLGQFESGNPGAEFSEISRGQEIKGDEERGSRIEITGVLKGKELALNIGYNKNEFEAENIAKFSSALESGLKDIIQHCYFKEEREYTPADLGTSGLSIDELTDVLDIYNS